MMSPFCVAIAIFLFNACRGQSNIWINKTPCETQRHGVCVSTVRSDWKCPFTNGRSSPFGCPARYVCCIPSERARTRRRVPGGCGIPPLSSSGSVDRIAGGFGVKPGELPWMAMLSESIFAEGSAIYYPHCGGVIIHEYWILTSASCLSLHYPDLIRDPAEFIWFTGLVNVHNIKKNNSKNIQSHKVQKVFLHNKYDLLKGLNNIALVKLKQPIKFDNFSQPVCLPKWNDSLENTICTVSGWGPRNLTRYPSLTLVGLNTPVIDFNTCAKLYREKWRSNAILETHMCTGFGTGDRAKCFGDLGSPLACRMNNGQYVLGGIASFGDIYGCGGGTLPGVYTKVASYINWIENTTGIEFPK